MNSVGCRIRAFAVQKYGSIKGLADALGKNPANVHKYISGNRSPGLSFFDELKKLGCSTEWLRTGKGEMFEGKKAGKQGEDQRSAPVQQGSEEGIKYVAKHDEHRGMIAVGSRMTPGKIEEGDFLVIDVDVDPKQGDYVLTKSQDAPEIVRFNTGDPAPIGVVVKLVRTYR